MSGAREVEERAAHWLLRREEADWSEEDQHALDDWLDRSPAHKAAYWRLEHGWASVRSDLALAEPDSAFREAAEDSRRVRWRRWVIPTALAASLAAGLMALPSLTDRFWPSAPERIAEQHFETARGQRARAALADGSTVELNTASSVRAVVAGGRREVWLDRGEAFFSVARREGARFVVHADDVSITVLGTRFNVRREDGRMILSVLEGRVELKRGTDDPSGRSIVVTGGDIAVIEGASVIVTAGLADKVADTLGWRDGMLVFDQVSLAEAAAEFNRYNDKAMVVTDAGAAQLRIGGAFKSSNADAFAHLLREAYGLHVVDDGETIRISSR